MKPQFTKAAKDGLHEEVTRLADMGMPIDIKDKWGYTPLYLAVENGHLKTVRVLVDRGAI